MNAYSLLDRELERLYADKARLMEIMVQIVGNSNKPIGHLDPRRPSGFGNSVGQYAHDYEYRMIEEQLRNTISTIGKMQTVIASIVMESDKLIQEKVAEMALTGVNP